MTRRRLSAHCAGSCSSWTWPCAPATGGQEALNILAETKASLIISDQRMPGMTGVEFLQKSRKVSPDSIRVLLTGYADINAVVEAINSGAVRYYFTKPWDDEFLLSRIKESLMLHQTISENRRLAELTRKQNQELIEFNRTLECRVAEQTGQIKKQNEELVASFMETIKAFSTIIELRHKEVGSHTQRAAALVKKMLQGMGLGQKEYQDVVVAAFLHDIGKINYPDGLLKKSPEEQTQRDREIIAQHPILGQSCVLAIGGFEDVGLIIRHHHEHFDGSGYPDNLKEKRIPLGARMIQVADSFDHHAFAKSYPDRTRLNEAAAHLVLHSGTKFDPDVVKRFIDLDLAQGFYHRELSDTITLRAFELEKGMIVADDIHTTSGLFILPKGAKLSTGMISRIIKIDRFDTIKNGIMVFKQRRAERQEPQQATAKA